MFKMLVNLSGEKSNEMADTYRKEANEHFNRCEFLEALTLYNKSICHAVEGSGSLGLAYANRSAIYLEAKLFKECLANIELARQHGYPANKIQKLNEREEKCKTLMETYKADPTNDPWNFFKLSYPPNEKIPFIVNCLELKENKKFGRYIVTNSDLKPGDIIAIEEPFYSFTDKKVCFSRCAYCLKSNKLSLIPCMSCTNSKLTSLQFPLSFRLTQIYLILAMYCSAECKKNHEKFSHTFDCGDPFISDHFVTPAKMFFTSVSIAGGFDELRGLLSDKTRRTVFDFDLSNPDDPSYKKNLLLAVNSLDMSCTTWGTIPLYKMVKRPEFASLSKTAEEQNFMFQTLTNQLHIFYTNQFQLKEHTRELLPYGIKFINDALIGTGLFPFASLLNHSCDANIKRVAMDNKIVLYATKPVAAGNQLCISYGYSSFRLPRAQRHDFLQSFGFKCGCEACQLDYPQMMKLPRKDPTFIEPRPGPATIPIAINIFKKNCKYIEKNFNRHPSYETMVVMENLDHYVNQMAKISVDNIEKLLIPK